MSLLTCILLLLAANLGQVLGHAGHNNDLDKVDILMPSVAPKVESQLCHGISLNGTINIVGYEPKAKMPVAHHMLLYGCGELGRKEEVWDCGEMQQTSESSQYQHGDVCHSDSDSNILYAWAMNAPELKLPEGVAFKVGEGTPFKYLVLQVHYKDVRQFVKKPHTTDNSGVSIVTSKKEHPKTAGIFLMLSDGVIPHSSTVYMDISCRYDDLPTIHPFAFRTHTHTHGKVVSGYVIKKNTNKWMEIGKKDPQLPQMFYNTTTPGITLEEGDIMAARCTMVNDGDKDVYIGTTSEDEMCNFYTMYWTDSPKHLLKNMYCVNSETPFKNWLSNLDAGQLETMPKDVSVIPGKTDVIKERFWNSDDVESRSDSGGNINGKGNSMAERKSKTKMIKMNKDGGKSSKAIEKKKVKTHKITHKKEFVSKNKVKLPVNNLVKDDDYNELSQLVSDYEGLLRENEGYRDEYEDVKYPYINSDMIRKLRNEYKYGNDEFEGGLVRGGGSLGSRKRFGDGVNGDSDRMYDEDTPTRRQKYWYTRGGNDYENESDNKDVYGGRYVNDIEAADNDLYERRIFNKRFTPYDFLATDGMKKRNDRFINRVRNMGVDDGGMVDDENVDAYIPYKRYIY